MFTVKLIVLVGLLQFSVQDVEKVYMSCGSPCPLTCDNYQDPPICLAVCSSGYFCPEGTVEHGELCIPSSECPTEALPPTTTSPPTTTDDAKWCPPGMVYFDCGPLCHLDCANPYEYQCDLDQGCEEGCYCAEGTVQHGDDCVHPEECGDVSTPPPPPTTGAPSCSGGKEHMECGPVCKETCNTLFGNEASACFSLRCFPGCFCPEGTVEHEGECISHVDCPNFPCKDYFCPDNFRCELDQLTRLPKCERSVYVPCTADVPLACDSEFLRCVVENTTRQATCLPSCFLDNGNCDYDQTCVVAEALHGSTVQCLDSTKLPTECPAGMVMNQCGSLCQETCDDVLKHGLKICPLVCGPADCTCPPGLVTYRDRCVDPKECYSLELYPPQLKLLPSVRTDVGLFLLSPRDRSVSRSDFSEIQEDFLSSLEELLSDQTGVKVELHAVLESDGGLELYVLLSGGNVSPETLNYYADLLAGGTLPIPVDDVVIIDVPQVKRTAHTVPHWIIVVGIVAGIVLILIVLAVLLAVCCCYAFRKRKMEKPRPSKRSIQYSSLVNEGLSEKENVA